MDRTQPTGEQKLIQLYKDIYIPGGVRVPANVEARTFVHKKTHQVGVVVIRNWKDKAKFLVLYRLSGRYHVDSANRRIAQQFKEALDEAKTDFRVSQMDISQRVRTWDLGTDAPMAIAEQAARIAYSWQSFDIVARNTAAAVAKDPRFSEQHLEGTHFPNFATFAKSYEASASEQREFARKTIPSLIGQDPKDGLIMDRAVTEIGYEVAHYTLTNEPQSQLAEVDSTLDTLAITFGEQTRQLVNGQGDASGLRDTSSQIQFLKDRLEAAKKALPDSSPGLESSLKRANTLIDRAERTLAVLQNNPELGSGVNLHAIGTALDRLEMDLQAQVNAVIANRGNESDVLASISEINRLGHQLAAVSALLSAADILPQEPSAQLGRILRMKAEARGNLEEAATSQMFDVVQQEVAVQELQKTAEERRQIVQQQNEQSVQSVIDAMQEADREIADKQKALAAITEQQEKLQRHYATAPARLRYIWKELGMISPLSLKDSKEVDKAAVALGQVKGVKGLTSEELSQKKLQFIAEKHWFFRGYHEEIKNFKDREAALKKELTDWTTIKTKSTTQLDVLQKDSQVMEQTAYQEEIQAREMKEKTVQRKRESEALNQLAEKI